MGRKKKKASKPWCWYCNREFDDEKILIQHQKAKHFKCHICHKRLYTGPGLAIHCMQVHKEKIDRIPNSLPHRINTEIEIYGMEGIPAADIKAHEEGKGKGIVAPDDESSNKRLKMDGPPGMMGPMGPMGHMGPMGPRGPMGGPMMGPMGGPMMRPMGPMGPMGGPMMGGPMGMMSPMGPGMRPMGPMGGMMGPRGPVGHMPPSMGTPPPGSMTQSTPRTVSNTMSMPPGTSQSGPVRPLFPSAAATTQASAVQASTPVGPDFKPTQPSVSATVPVRPTFPAYGQQATSAGTNKSSPAAVAPPTVKKPESSSGMTTKLVHPSEDISLEERRLSMSKYKSHVSGSRQAVGATAGYQRQMANVPTPHFMSQGVRY